MWPAYLTAGYVMPLSPGGVKGVLVDHSLEIRFAERERLKWSSLAGRGNEC